jgi:hypothetical protein
MQCFDVVVKRKVNTNLGGNFGAQRCIAVNRNAAKARLAWRAISLERKSKPAHGANFEFL